MALTDIGSNVPAHITTLASELILRVFGILGTGEATCLGLTCSHFYIVLKDLYPESISLRTQIVLRGRGLWYRDGCCLTDLYQVLANWVGPCYRMGRRTNVKLLYYNSEVYGGPSKYNSQNPEWRSNGRHRDYQMAQHISINNYRPNLVFPNPLPNLFNKGDAWNAEATASIEATIFQFESTKEWKQFWIYIDLFYYNQKHFDRFEDRYL
jgi:hypothetical protein